MFEKVATPLSPQLCVAKINLTLASSKFQDHVLGQLWNSRREFEAAVTFQIVGVLNFIALANDLPHSAILADTSQL